MSHSNNDRGKESSVKESPTMCKFEKYHDAVNNYPHFRHASHVMIYAPCDKVFLDIHKTRAAILMQARFDGKLGFPGGLIDAGECPVAALNRELVEEVGIDPTKLSVQQSDHVCTFVDDDARFILHFFTLEVSAEEFSDLERRVLSCIDYGTEVMGIVRPPLFTLTDGKNGFPTFLTNNFAGNARDELLIGIVHAGILTQEEVDEARKIADGLIRRLTGAG